MDPFSGIEAFVATCEEGSFRAASQRLGVTPAAVSKAVSRLEDDLKVQLFDRTTRTVALTAAGQLYLVHCRRALDEMFLARERVEQTRAVVEGELVVALSSVLGASLSRRLAGFFELYPGLKIRFVFGDRPSRLVQEQIDVALRIGPLADTTALALRLTQLKWATVAAPAYLEKRGYPTHPRELREHDRLVYRSPRGKDVAWEFLGIADDESRALRSLKPRLVTDEGRVLIDAAKSGLGIAHVFYELVSDEIEAGRLVLLLVDHAPPGPALHALSQPGRARTPRVRAFLNFLATQYRR